MHKMMDEAGKDEENASVFSEEGHMYLWFAKILTFICFGLESVSNPSFLCLPSPLWSADEWTSSLQRKY